MSLPVAFQPAAAAPPTPRAARAAASPEPADRFEAMLSRSSADTPHVESGTRRNEIAAARTSPEDGEQGQEAAAADVVAVVIVDIVAPGRPATPEPTSVDAVGIEESAPSPLQTAAEMPEDALVATEESLPVQAETGVASPDHARERRLAPVEARPEGRSAGPVDPGLAESGSVNTAPDAQGAGLPKGQSDDAPRQMASEPSESVEPATTKSQAPAPRRADARSTAKAIVSEFLQAHSATQSSRTPPPAAAASTTVATAPLQPVVAQAVNESTTPSRSSKAAEVVQDAIVEAGHAAPDPTLQRPAGDAGSAGGERRPDGGRPQGGTRGTAGSVDLPASLAFPHQMTFAAAVDRAMPARPAIPLAPATPEQLATVGPQVVRSMHMQVKAGGGDMTLTLTPEHLGTVTIQLRVDQQKVSATLGADTAAVRGWISAHEQDLKAGLADVGLHLDGFVVRDDDPRQHQQRHEQQSPNGRRKPVREGEAVFEVVV